MKPSLRNLQSYTSRITVVKHELNQIIAYLLAQKKTKKT